MEGGRGIWEGYSQHLSLHRAEPLSGILNYQVGLGMLINHRAEGCQALLGPSLMLRAQCAEVTERQGLWEQGPAQQPSQSDLTPPNFTLFRLWLSNFR